MSIGVAVRAESEFHVTGRNPVNAVISIRALSVGDLILICCLTMIDVIDLF